MRFRSRVDTWLGVLLWGTSLVCYLLAVAIFFAKLNPIVQILFAVLFVVSGIITHSAVVGTVYIIGQGNLSIKSGILIRKSIPLKRIAKVSRVVSREASAALSRKRLRVFCGQIEYVDVSPEREDEFIQKLKEDAPHVHIEPDARV